MTHLRGTVPRFRVRPCKAAELTRLPMIETAADAVFPAGRVPIGEVTLLAELRAALENESLYVAAVREEVVAFAAGLPYGTSLHLRTLAVHPAHGRQGMGTALVRSLVEQAEQRGFADVTLTTFADLPFNAPFYERVGFRALRADELDARLAALLQAESAAGMVRRVAMRRSVRSPEGEP